MNVSLSVGEAGKGTEVQEGAACCYDGSLFNVAEARGSGWARGVYGGCFWQSGKMFSAVLRSSDSIFQNIERL